MESMKQMETNGAHAPFVSIRFTLQSNQKLEE